MPRPRSSTPTQAMIAAATGVSVPTVSKALRNDPSISDRTRSLVQSSARELGYPWSGLHEVSNPSDDGSVAPTRVAVLFDTVDNAYASQVLRGVLTAARTLDITIQVDQVDVSADQEGADEGEQLTTALALRAVEHADGLILVTALTSKALLSECSRRSIPVVAVDPAVRPPEGLLWLSSSNWRGGLQASEHLLQLGHRRVGVVCGPASSVPSMERLAGYRSALNQAGVTFAPELVVPGRFDFEAGLAGGKRLLDLGEPPTAVFAMSDSIAIGVIAAARQRGLRVPEDLSVVGFDDTSIARLAFPALTVIHQPLEEMGGEALRLMERAIGHGRAAGRPVELQTGLVIRSSTAAPGGGGSARHPE